MLRPTKGQQLTTSDGKLWVVHKVVADELEEGNYVVQLLPFEKSGDFLAETLDVYMAEWPQFCKARGVALATDP